MAETLGGAAVPTVGLGSLIVLLVGYLVRAIVSDRSDYRDRITAEQTTVLKERDRADLAQLQVDEEMSRRREADRRAAAAEAELEAQRIMVGWYTAEVDRLRREIERIHGTLPPDGTGG